MAPAVKPNNPNFSSGPCSKRPGYSVENLELDTLGRSHRSALGKKALKDAIDKSKELLGLPEGYRLGIVPASDTGAMEMIMWSVLGARPVDVCYWESFGKGWMADITKELKIAEVNKYEADYGQLPDLSQVNPAHDVVFTWNGTTSGVKVPNGDWISDDREGLTICDATSAVFAMDMPWEKLDVVTYSWQKVLGGEGAHGVLILSPKAVERLESFTPDRPLPKIFRLTKAGKLIEGIFTGATINTPSMLAVADYLDALQWVEASGGVEKMIDRSNANLAVLEKFVAENDWINFLAEDPAIRSNTSVCLTLDLPADKVKELISLLGSEGAANDIGAYRDAPAGLRIWCGATVETSDLEALMPWLAWAYEQVKA
jgi:phosphoserine aminotransferase